MTLSEPARIDITAEAPDGTIVLGIVAVDWSDPSEQRKRLARKLATYLSYLHTPEYEERFGSKDAAIQLVTESEPPPEITELLRATEEASGVPMRVQTLGSAGTGVGVAGESPEAGGPGVSAEPREPADANPAPAEPQPRGLPKNVAVEPRPSTIDPEIPRGRRTARSRQAGWVRKIRMTFALLGLVLGVAAGVWAWVLSDSVALAVFIFFMANYLVSRGVADVITDPKKIRRALYFAFWPAVGTGLLYVAWRQWETMWLAVLVGFIGGLVLHTILAPRLFPTVHAEEMKDSIARTPEGSVQRRMAKHLDE